MIAVCALCRDEHSSEWAAFDKVPKCLCSTFQRKSLSDDRLDLARPEKPCDRRPCFCQNGDGLSEQREAFDARTLPDQVRHIDCRFSARCIAERGETSARRQDPERFAQDIATETIHDYVCPITIAKATHTFRQPFRREVARYKSGRAQCNERSQVRDRNTRGGIINI